MGSNFRKSVTINGAKGKWAKAKIHKELPWLDIAETPEKEEHNVPI